MTQTAYTAAEIAQALEINERSARRRADKESWPFEERPGPGGRVPFYGAEALPPDVRRALHLWEMRQAPETHSPQPAEIPGQGIKNWLAVGEAERAVALARLAVLRVQAEWVGRRNGQRGHHTAVVREFYGRLSEALRCAGGDACATRDACSTNSLSPQPSPSRGEGIKGLLELGFLEHEIAGVLAHVKKVSMQTAYRWQAALQKSREQGAGSGVAGLAPKYNWDEDAERRQVKASRRGYGVKTMTPEMVAAVRLMFVKGQSGGGVQLYPAKRSAGWKACATGDAAASPILTCNKALLHRRLSLKFSVMPHLRHFDRWVNQYLVQEGEGLAAICLPSWWRANCQPKAGCAGEKADYFGQMWELDGTPADVMLQDGRHEILAAVDIFSRDALMEVEKHATSLTVAKLFHQGIINWGVPERVITDKGTIFISKQIVNACAHLETDLEMCDAYAPWEKPHVESFFGSLARVLFEALPWYIGHNPAQRKRIEEYHRFQNVFYHRRGEKISCEATAQELREVLQHWLVKVYRPEPHRFKDAKLGRSLLIWERQANSPRRAPRLENPEYLNALLAPAISRTFRSGVTWENAPYLPQGAEAWQAAQKFAGQKVIFKPDLEDISRGTLWEQRADGTAGALICRVDSSLMNKDGLAEYLKAKKTIIKAHKRRRRAAEQLGGPRGYDRELARMPMPKVAVGGFGQQPYEGEAYRSLVAHDDRFGLKLVADQCRDERIAQEAAALAAGRQEKEQSLEEMKESPGCRRYEDLVRRAARGERVEGDEAQFMRYFEISEDYRRLAAYFEEVKLQAATEIWEK